MLHIKFKNMEKSDLARKIVTERVSEAIHRFPKANIRLAVATLEMENAPLQPGIDSFKVRLELIGGRYHGIILEKTSDDIYKALAYVCDGLLERLNRYSDRLRTKATKDRRTFASLRRRFQLRAQGE